MFYYVFPESEREIQLNMVFIKQTKKHKKASKLKKEKKKKIITFKIEKKNIK